MRQQPLTGMSPPDEMAALQAAYRRVPGLARRMSLEKALGIESVAHCLRVMAGLPNKGGVDGIPNPEHR